MMTGRLKTLGVAMAATLALGMATVGGAQALEIHATTPNAASILANQTTQHALVFDAGTLKCSQVLLEGLILNTGESKTQSTVKDMSLTGTYTTCTLSGLAAIVDMNGCKYTITGVSDIAAQMDITGCTPGKVIEVTTAMCTVTLPEQHGRSQITFSNTSEASPHDLDASIALSGLTYQTHGTCPNTASNHTSQTTNGEYTGSMTIQAREPKGTEQKTHNGHTYEKLKQTGGLVGLLTTVPPLYTSELHATTPNAASIHATQTTQHAFTVDAGIVKCTQNIYSRALPRTPAKAKPKAQPKTLH